MPTTNENAIRIFIDIPEGYIDVESPALWVAQSVRQEVEQQLKAALIEQYVGKLEMPDITVTPEEVKDRILTILAEQAVEKLG